MNDQYSGALPQAYESIQRDSAALGFGMPSDRQTGALLKMLATAKPRGCFLELGTGTGLGAAWLLDGMDAESTLVSVENNAAYQQIARKHLSGDKRVKFLECDGLKFLEEQKENTYDFIYADTWPGKYVGFEHSLRILKPGGLLLLDDMLPQPNWPADHPPKVETLLKTIEQLSAERFSVVRMCWYTGHILISKR